MYSAALDALFAVRHRPGDAALATKAPVSHDAPRRLATQIQRRVQRQRRVRREFARVSHHAKSGMVRPCPRHTPPKRRRARLPRPHQEVAAVALVHVVRKAALETAVSPCMPGPPCPRHVVCRALAPQATTRHEPHHERAPLPARRLGGTLVSLQGWRTRVDVARRRREKVATTSRRLSGEDARASGGTAVSNCCEHAGPEAGRAAAGVTSSRVGEVGSS
eukprot:scaffold11921_cov102-Isochrysis_galbana.AAC.2